MNLLRLRLAKSLLAIFLLGYAHLGSAIPEVCLVLGQQFDGLERPEELISRWRLFIGLHQVERLSGGVNKIPLTDGSHAVVRIQNELTFGFVTNDALFERFAAGFLGQMGFKIAIPKRLTAPEQLYRSIRKVETDNRYQEAVDGRAPLTIVPFYNLTLGKDYLDAVGGRRGVPKSLRQELADLWGLYVVLGIPDFHASNWMTDGKSIMPIDLALRSNEFIEAEVVAHLGFQQEPYGFEGIRAHQSKELVREMSEDMIKKFESLNREEIFRLAIEYDSSINIEQIDGMIGRAKSLAEIWRNPQ